MAIQISNFNPVWKYNNNQSATDSIAQYYDGTYLYLQCAINNGTSVDVNIEIWNFKPAYYPYYDPSVIITPENYVSPAYTGSICINNVNFGNIETDVQGNVLLASHEAVVAKLSELNPSVTFDIVDLSGSVV
jgi:hypothetical protein